MVEILIAGAGSIGTVLGMLLDSEHLVKLLRRKTDLGKKPISMKGVMEMELPMEIVSMDQLDSFEVSTDDIYQPDIIFVTTQMQQLDTICKQLSKTSIIARDTIIVGMQNGIDGPNILLNYFPDNPVLAATVWWSATTLNSSNVLYHRKAVTVLGIPSGSRADNTHLDKIVKILDNKFEVETTDDLIAELRKKLILNVVSPPLALIKQPYPQGLVDISTRKMVHALFDEALETANLLDWNIDSESDSRLSGFHQLLITGDLPKNSSNKSVNDYTHKVSTQLGMEKYGGKLSNVRALLGWLQLSGSLLADEIIRLVDQQEPGYGAVDSSVFDLILSSTSSARCTKEE